MIGHCIPASGIASLVKTSLALYHKVLPPTLCNEVNTDLEFENKPFYVNTEVRPWIHGHSELPRRAGVSAFGFGGINAHLILEEYTQPSPLPNFHSRWSKEMLVFSGSTTEEVIAQIQQVQQYLQIGQQVNLANLAYTLAQKPIETHRLIVIAGDVTDLEQKLSKTLKKLATPHCDRIKIRSGIYYTKGASQQKKSKIAFLFPGEGSQYPNMLADLCIHFPSVRTWFDMSDLTFNGIWSNLPSQFIFPPPSTLTDAENNLLSQGLYDIDIATEVIFTADLALFELLSEFNIPVDAMVGHSTGEYASLVASQTIKKMDFEQSIQTKRNLNCLYKKVEEADQVSRGTLLTVGALPAEFFAALLEEFEEKIYLAMDNCPNQKILFIPSSSDLAEVKQHIKAAGGVYQQLPFDRAYHTPLFAPMGSILEQYYAQLPIQSSQTPLYSCATAKQFPDEPDEIRNLALKQWSAPVKFQEMIEHLYAQGHRIFVEVGPSNNLTSFVDNILQDREYIAIASNNRRKSGIEQLLRLIAQLIIENINVDLSPLFKYRKVQLVNINEPLTDNPKTNSLALELKIPKLTLSKEAIKHLQDKLFANPPKPPSQKPTLAQKAEKEHSHSQDTPLPQQQKTSKTAPNQQAKETKVDPTIEKSSSLQSDLYILHTELMNSFLRNQEQVSNALFSKLAREDENDRST